MFEELSNDLKVVKEYCVQKAFTVTIDASYKSDEALDSLKSREGLAYISTADTAGSKRYKNISGAPDLSALADKTADCVISRDALCEMEDPKAFISSCRRVVKDGGTLILCGTVPDIEDAYFNTVGFFKNKNHVRFYSVKEIIEYATEWFRLEYYVRTEKVISIETWLSTSSTPKDEIVERLMKFPDIIKKDMNFVSDSHDELLGFTLKCGVFVFKALPELEKNEA